MVVQYAACSVRVSRSTRNDPAAPLRLLLCLDGSEHADAALHEVAERPWPAETEVQLLTVIGPYSDMTVSEFQVDLDRAEAFHGIALPRLNGKGLKLTTAVKNGDPKRVIIERAEEWGADSIFLGSRGLNRFHRFLGIAQILHIIM
jgi:nucleotide-binding universal stress UspA family protein